PLAPLQEGILYHHLTAEQGDPYLLQLRINVDSLERLNAVAAALRTVIARHDSLRTAIVWQGLEVPQQVVWRHADLTVERVAPAQIEAEAGTARMDLARAPLIRLLYSPDATGAGLSAM
ncbi:condensation domain-containing protein, partial [Pseudomonas syringae]